MDAPMRLGYPARPLKDQRLSSMQGGKIGGAAGVFTEFNRQYRVRVSKGWRALSR